MVCKLVLTMKSYLIMKLENDRIKFIFLEERVACEFERGNFARSKRFEDLNFNSRSQEELAPIKSRFYKFLREKYYYLTYSSAYVDA